VHLLVFYLNKLQKARCNDKDNILYYNIIHSLVIQLSYVRSVVDCNVVMRRILVLGRVGTRLYS